MAKLPKDIKLTKHAQQRLLERNSLKNMYNTKNLMKSSCKWYGKDDLIPESSLYLHCLYVCRKSKQMGYLTDGNIEVLYNRNTGVAITIMEVKEKFLPITQYIKPEYLKQIELKKEKKKMRKTNIGVCPDCGKEVKLTLQGICIKCKTRKANMKYRGKEYVPYINLSEEEKRKIDIRQITNSKEYRENHNKKEEIPMPEIPVIENYYEVKATQNPAIAHVVEKPKTVEPEITEKTKIQQNTFNPLLDENSFIHILKECGCTLPENTIKSILDALLATDKLKSIITTITKNGNQNEMLNLEYTLNAVEQKLQYNWETNGFQEVDDIKFKGFLVWRRVLKEAINFWKELYKTNTLTELTKALNTIPEIIKPIETPTIDDTNNTDKTNNTLKRFQITTESISTIFNTKRPFTRVFYATSKEEAHEKFVKWMSERQLHENKNKTIITELTEEGEDGRNEVK